MRPRLSPHVVGWLAAGSCAWLTLCLTVWVAFIVVEAGGLDGFALVVVGYIGFGVPFGALGAGLTIAGMATLRRVVRPPHVAVVLSALIAWSCVLVVWVLFAGPGYFVEGRLALTSAVAAGGAVYSCVVCWPTREATVEA
jgi:hypothetical protein